MGIGGDWNGQRAIFIENSGEKGCRGDSEARIYN